MNKFKESLNYLFNWKKNPASVFLFAVPLAFAGFFLHGWYAYLMWKVNGQWGYSVIVLVALVVLAIGIWPVRKRLFAS